eukprot:CAMPEP_0116875820 /NCGR_PEP_ID=MMETSP0463-20121206/7931_1 /TAXON_ID=181622 /ORGANISM="Strombidinopsis sp, Strain SopsisLIS2011" /LENGTH=64 /DNA_ID=CAMNT_0004522145 /DNA_START=18 /DNA_END=212 /DNA_ORIENTATION=+
MVSNSAYGLIAPFLPQELAKKDIGQDMVGIIFAIYSIAVIIMSLGVGKAFDYLGQSNLLAWGLF